jgi:septum formation protein
VVAPGALVLASESPRRLAVLASMGIVPDRVVAPCIDETPLAGELPRVLAARLARGKAMVPADDGAFVLAADTVVALGRRALPGVSDVEGARDCLTRLSGRAHRVFTSVVLRAPDGTLSERMSESHVTFARLSADQMERYLESGEWRGKAGGYAIQGLAASFVRAFQGSYSGVVGLPVFETAQLLRGKGWRVP